MLTVVPIKNSSISKGYYLKQDGGYYIENKEDKLLYQWHGKACEKLDLIGNIDPKIHSEVFSGLLPNGIQIGKKSEDGIYQGRPGYDLTFSMNKDLSLIICCSENKVLSDYFLHAHIDAVKTVLNQVEKKIQARTTLDGKTDFENTKNMISALCTHFSSRAGDPDIHTHALVANATERSDGAWRALATDLSRNQGFFEKMRDNAVFYGTLYQNEMAMAAKKQGFSIEPIYKNGMFKITGFSDELRDHFSKRRKQIEKIIGSFDSNIQIDKNLFEQVAKHSKSEKEKISSTAFIEKSKIAMRDFFEKKDNTANFDSMLEKCKMHNLTNDNTDQKALSLLKDAIKDCSQFQNNMKLNTLISKAMSFSIGECGYHEFIFGIKSLIASGDLIKSDMGFTTKSIQSRDDNLFNCVFRALPQGNRASNFNPKNQDELSENLTDSLSKSRLCIINEPKDINSKEALLSKLIEDFKSKNKSVSILASNKILGIAYNETFEKPGDSIWQRVKNIGQSDLAKSIHSFLFHYDRELKTPFSDIFTKKGREVFIVDDASMLSFDAVQKLLSLTEKRQSSVIFLKSNSGRKNDFTGNPIAFIEKVGVNKIDASKLFQSDKKQSKTHIQIESKACGVLDRQKISSEKAVAHILNSKDMVLSLSSSKKSASQLNNLIRNKLIEQNKIEKSSNTITVSESVSLSEQSQKYASSYPKGAFIRQYAGNGQFISKKIMGHDLKNNQIIVKGFFGACSKIQVSKISKEIKQGHLQIYNEKNLSISTGDIVRLTKGDIQSDLLHLKLGRQYQISKMDEKYTYFDDKTGNSKTIKIKSARLNGLALSYDYARSVHEPISEKNIQKIVLDLPSRSISKSLLDDLSRRSNNIQIVTDKENAVLKNTKIKSESINAQINKNVIIKSVIPPSFDEKKTEDQLKLHTALITEKILGAPNENLSNQNEWRYGTRGEVTVIVNGKNQGSFYNKMTGEVGDVKTLLARSMDISNQDALEYGRKVINENKAQHSPVMQRDSLNKNAEKEMI